MFEGITREDVEMAIREIDELGIRKGRHSSTYDLVLNGKRYPPKLVLSIANRFANGRELEPNEFGGGEGTEAFRILKQHGFQIERKRSRKVWIEKTIVKSRPDRIEGERKLGSALWSPRRSKDGKDIYKEMRAVERGDVVLHLTDDEGFTGVSLVSSECEEGNGLQGTAWSGPAYIVKLEGHKTLEPPLPRDVFLDKANKEVLDSIREANKVFYNEKLALNQGFYLTECPESLVAYLNSSYRKLSGLQLPYIQELIVDEDIENTANQMTTHLNTILYGPPGTGKTYNSIDLAARIATGKSSSHESNKREFDELRKQEQVEFVTFHQNYAYEDFIIGIKPDLQSGQLSFKRSEGVFYRICKRAELNYLASKESKLALKPFEVVFSEFLKPLQENDQEIEIKMTSGTTSFWITDINPSNLNFRKQSGGTDHTLSIDTIKELYHGEREFNSGLKYYYVPLLNKLWELGRQAKQKVDLKQYVLIIDEINRANISKVFGEIITLLEEDKRIGQKNELRVTLPNANDFGVPPNLHIIGTMNTADKSIALIDIALRRRFRFIGAYPKYDLDELSDEAKTLLRQINDSILERKKSADYLIGHAYFMNNDDISQILIEKVIPLLMEYFSGKSEIVGEIFKNTVWSVTYNASNYSWDIVKNK